MNKNPGGLKKLIRLFSSIRIPWLLYIAQVVLGMVSTQIALEYVQYDSQMKLGNIEVEGVVLGYVLMLLLNLIVSVLSQVPSFYASSIMNRNLQNRLISRALHLPIPKFEENGSRMVGWIIHDCSYADGAITSLVGFVTGSFSMYMSIARMSAIDRTMVSLVPIIVIYILFSTWVNGRLMFVRQEAFTRANAGLTAFFSEHMGFFHQVRQLHAEEEELSRGKQAIREYYRLQVYQCVVNLINNFVSGPITSVITILVFVLGVPKVRTGEISMPDLVAFQSYILLAYNNFNTILGLYPSFMYYNGTLYYISNLMNETEETYTREKTMDLPDQNLIFDHVSFGYENKPVLNDASFTIPKGKLTMVVGPNGTGKSTVFKLLQRFYMPEQGQIFFGDVPAESIHLNEWRQSIAYVLQDPQLFDGTVRENIVYGMDREVSESEIRAAAELAAADEFIRELPGGYDFVIGDNGCRLSGGQRQRIAIARAMLLDPDYLLLDEATCNVDVMAEKKIMDRLFAQMKDRTTVMITHNMDMLKRADHLIVLNGGGVEACGPAEEVMKSSETVRRLIEASGQAA